MVFGFSQKKYPAPHNGFDSCAPTFGMLRFSVILACAAATETTAAKWHGRISRYDGFHVRMRVGYDGLGVRKCFAVCVTVRLVSYASVVAADFTDEKVRCPEQQRAAQSKRDFNR